MRAGGAQISDRVLERCRVVASTRLSDLLARGRRGVDLWRRAAAWLQAASGLTPPRVPSRFDTWSLCIGKVQPLRSCAAAVVRRDGQAGDVSLPRRRRPLWRAPRRDGRRRTAGRQRAMGRGRKRQSRLRHLEPGALAQPSHRDGPDGLDRVRSLTAFVPRNGLTSLRPRRTAATTLPAWRPVSTGRRAPVRLLPAPRPREPGRHATRGGARPLCRQGVCTDAPELSEHDAEFTEFFVVVQVFVNNQSIFAGAHEERWSRAYSSV